MRIAAPESSCTPISIRNLIAQAVPEDTKQYISGYIANSKMLEAAEATA